MIGEFERRIAEMSEPMVQVSYAAMVLAAAEAMNERSFSWFDDRAQVALKELERRGSLPRPLDMPGPSCGTQSNRSLTQEQAAEIRGWWKRRVSVLELARHYGVSEITIRRIVTDKTYRELPPSGGPDHLRMT